MDEKQFINKDQVPKEKKKKIQKLDYRPPRFKTDGGGAYKTTLISINQVT